MDDIKEITLFVCDSEKYGEEDIIGFSKLALDDIKLPTDEKTEYLQREDGLRTRCKLLFSYKIQPSKVYKKY